MKINYTTNNISIAKHASPKFKAEAPKPAIKPSVNNASKINEARYNTIGAAAGLTVLAGIGFALLHGDKLFKALSSTKRMFTEPKAHEIKIYPMSYNNGPKFDVTKGKTAIADAWNGYINDVEKRIKSHKTNYIDIFTKNSEQLDKYEAIIEIKNKGKKGAYEMVA